MQRLRRGRKNHSRTIDTLPADASIFGLAVPPLSAAARRDVARMLDR